MPLDVFVRLCHVYGANGRELVEELSIRGREIIMACAWGERDSGEE